ncbi:MAG: MiaB/RimO family radical SAM methylthiotransferase [Candidatus Lambdaproteobacteria bacterium]|nr:MiaB/RimO family radical SAM methylthiotransferase [Candidatus Lambdaproteobacteria bacterium]
MGCRLNHAETAVLQRSLEAAGYRIVPWGEEAELCVLNSCTVTGQAEAKARQALGSIRRRQPAARLAVVGCYAQTGAARLAELGLADLIVGNGAKLRLVEHLGRLEPGAAPQADRVLPQAVRPPPQVVRPPIPRMPFAQEVYPTLATATRAPLKIQDGCDFMCSFCIIPVSRGRSRPRTLANLLAEARHQAAAGARELVLTGVNLGTYCEGAAGLLDVVDALDAIPGIARVRLSSIEPTTVAEGLLERMADPAHALAPFLHLPLQSGSARVLAAMRRRYDPAAYRRFAEQALERVADLCLGTDVMVGFPGEDDDAFAETHDLLAALPCAYFHVFPYSERPGTAAVRMVESGAAASVPSPIRQRRAALLRRLGEEKRLAFHRRQLGRTLDVLFERSDRPGVCQGYTANYIRVEVPAPEPLALHNRLLPVRLIEAGAEAVAGELIAPGPGLSSLRNASSGYDSNDLRTTPEFLRGRSGN